MNKFIFSITLLAIVIISIFGYVNISCADSADVVIYKTEYVDRNIQTTVYIPEPYPVEVPVPYEIEVPVYVDRIVETPTEYKEWESINQFIEWYGEQEFTVLMPSGAYKVDCDDYSARVQREALKDGYAVSQVLVNGNDYYGVRVRDATGGHAACMVMINKSYYYVEPSPRDFRIIYLVRRD